MAQTPPPPPRVGNFLVGTWVRAWAEIPPGTPGEGWASGENCHARSGATPRQALEAGIVIGADGRIASNDKRWSCALRSLKERPLDDRPKGLVWDFTASCDRSLPGVPPLPPDAQIDPAVNATGQIVLAVPTGEGQFYPMLRIDFDRALKPGETGILAIYPIASFGPYMRCPR